MCVADVASLAHCPGAPPGGVLGIDVFPKGGGHTCDFGCALPSDAKSQVLRINRCTTTTRCLRWHWWGNGFLRGPIYLQRMEHGPDTRVLFNTNCPVCNFEIGHYARYADRSGLPIRFGHLNTDARDQWNCRSIVQSGAAPWRR